MNLVPIPQATRLPAERTIKKHQGQLPWWHQTELPTHGIEAVATGRGSIKQGVKVYLIAGHDRVIYAGTYICEKLTIHEYVGLVDGTGWQPLVQLGRDVEMTK